jgi:hypothetical protein
MEYRLKYRDIPWSVAIMSLPLKIIGTFIGRPIEYIANNPYEFLIKVLWKLLWAFVLVIVFMALMTLADITFDGKLGFMEGVGTFLEERAATKEIRKRAEYDARIEQVRREIMQQALMDRPGKCIADPNGRCR